MADWKRIISDPRNPTGFTYVCKNGHEWFKTFDELRGMDSKDNNCPECANGTPTGESN